MTNEIPPDVRRAAEDYVIERMFQNLVLFHLKNGAMAVAHELLAAYLVGWLAAKEAA